MRSLLDKENLEHRINRIKGKLKRYEEVPNPSEYFNYHGGQSHGYLLGELNLLEDLLDELEER